MADNIDKALNGLDLKTDSLPSDWLITLVNPATGEPAENMTVAKFIELLTEKMPIATASSKGVLSTTLFDRIPKYDFIEDISILNKSLGISFNDVALKGDKILNNMSYGVALCFTGDHYKLNIVFDLFSGDIFYKTFSETGNATSNWRTITANTLPWTKMALSTSPNALTETVIEEVPVSADTPMTLQEDGQSTPTMQTVEHYEYSIQKMAEAILKLQKQVAELKA